MHKLAITDHAIKENHIINWAEAKAIDKERFQGARTVREAIWIRRTDKTMNRDEGAYQLARGYDCLTAMPSISQLQHTSV